MIHAFRGRSRIHQTLLVLAGIPVLALLVAEGLNTGFAPTAAATTATGALCVAALVVPPARFPLVAGCGVAASLALSLATLGLTQRPENTPGTTELCALVLVVARTVRREPLLRIIALALPASAAAGLLLLRLPEASYGQVAAYGAPAVLFALVLMVVLGLYLRVVDALRDRERAAVEQAARQDERLEHARELHDFVAHHVTAIVTQAKAARYVTSAGRTLPPAEVDRMFTAIEDAGSQAMESMRGMVSMLRAPGNPAATRPGGGLTQIRDLVEGFSTAGRTAARLTISPLLAERSLPPEISTTVHRLVREALTNIRKHAGTAGQVSVDIRLPDDGSDLLHVSIADDGTSASGTAHRTSAGAPGRPPATKAGAAGPSSPGRSRGGFGLLGLAERVEAIGGHLTAGPRQGRPGWEVVAGIPLPPASGRTARTRPPAAPTDSATMAP